MKATLIFCYTKLIQLYQDNGYSSQNYEEMKDEIRIISLLLSKINFYRAWSNIFFISEICPK